MGSVLSYTIEYLHSSDGDSSEDNHNIKLGPFPGATTPHLIDVDTMMISGIMGIDDNFDPSDLTDDDYTIVTI